MANDEHKDVCGDQGVVNGNDNYLSQQISISAGSDLEVNSPESKDSTKNDDPFGNETNSQVKYRTMTWWSVASPQISFYDSANNSIFTGNVECVCQLRPEIRAPHITDVYLQS